jgi:hypothetical protein
MQRVRLFLAGCHGSADEYVGVVETHRVGLFWQNWAYAATGSRGVAYPPALVRPDAGTACCGAALYEMSGSRSVSLWELLGSSHVVSATARTLSPAA